MMRTILHLCADIGSDSRPYEAGYNVIKIGKDVGVENYHPVGCVQGVIANPVCTDYSTATGFDVARNPDHTILMHCLRIIAKANPVWWVIENPANGVMSKVLGPPTYIYQPWWYGSPWTKKTALWGNFTIPQRVHRRWGNVPKIPELYTRPGRGKPSLVAMHLSAKDHIPEFTDFNVKTDADFRSLCSQGFAKAFKKANP